MQVAVAEQRRHRCSPAIVRSERRRSWRGSRSARSLSNTQPKSLSFSPKAGCRRLAVVLRDVNSDMSHRPGRREKYGSEFKIRTTAITASLLLSNFGSSQAEDWRIQCQSFGCKTFLRGKPGRQSSPKSPPLVRFGKSLLCEIMFRHPTTFTSPDRGISMSIRVNDTAPDFTADTTQVTNGGLPALCSVAGPSQPVAQARPVGSLHEGPATAFLREPDPSTFSSCSVDTCARCLTEVIKVLSKGESTVG